MRWFSKDKIIKFLIIDFVFLLVAYLTFIFSFPLKDIIKKNRGKIEEKIGFKFYFKDVSMGILGDIQFSKLRIVLPEEKKNRLYHQKYGKLSKKSDLKDDKRGDKESKDDKKGDKEAKDDKKDKKREILIKKLSVDPKISSILSNKPAFKFNLDIFGGEVKGYYEVRKTTPQSKFKRNVGKNKAKAKKIQTNYLSLNLKNISLTQYSEFMNYKLPVHGEGTGRVDLEFGTKYGKMKIFTLDADIGVKSGALGPGKMKTDMGMASINRVVLGDFLIGGDMDGTQLKLRPIEINSKDLEANIDGSIIFGLNIRPNLVLTYKFSDQFLAANKNIKNILMGMGGGKGNKEKSYKITGTTKKPRFTPYRGRTTKTNRNRRRK